MKCKYCNNELNSTNKRKIYCNPKCRYEDNKKEVLNKLYEWRKKNPNKRKEQGKRYREKNKDKIKSYEKIRRSNPEVKKLLSENVKRYYNTPKGRKKKKDYEELRLEHYKKIRHDWKVRNRKRLVEQWKTKYKNDPLFNLRHKLRSRVYFALMNYAKDGKIKHSDEYGINYYEIIKKLENDYGQKLTMDYLKDKDVEHTKPLFSFDFNNPEEIRKAFSPDNTTLMNFEEHLKKTAKENSLNFTKH